MAFDASASAASDSGPLQYFWDFGDGRHGGGATIAHVFGTAGTPSVSLTVIDAAGVSAKQAKVITITAGTQADATTTLDIVAFTTDGVPIAGVTVTPSGGTPVATDGNGKAVVTLGTGVRQALALTKSGYANQFMNVSLPAAAKGDGQLRVTMRLRDTALTLPDAAAGGTLSGRDGAVITLPPQGLIDASGGAITGPVSIALTPVDVTQPGAGGFPGDFSGIQPDGTSTPIVSMGTTEFILGSDGAPLQLAPGKTATIQLPLYAAKRLDGTVLAIGDTTPLWSLDERTSIWVQEGTGTVVASSASPSGLALQATVAHFSWWNSDLGFKPYGPKPKCSADTSLGIPEANDAFNTATICNMLADIDRTLGGNGSGASATHGATAKRAYHAKAVPLAAAPSPAVAGFSKMYTVPIAGGVSIPVPPDVDVRLTAYALNGTWTGTATVHGSSLVTDDVAIKLHPITFTGPAPQAITLPYDSTQAIAAAATAQFTFTGTAQDVAIITVDYANNSSFVGQVAVLQGTTVIGTISVGAGPVGVPLPSTGTYTIQVVNTDPSNPSALRIQGQEVKGTQSELLTPPLDITRDIAPFTQFAGTVHLDSPTAIYLASKQITHSATLNVLGPDGVSLYSVPAGSSSSLPSDALTVLSLPSGDNTVQVIPQDAHSTMTERIVLEKTSWAPVGPTFDAPNQTLVDLVIDRDGKLVVAFTSYQSSSNGSNVSPTLMLRRWTGVAWETVGADVTVNSCTSPSFAFDSANRPVILYGVGDGQGGSFTKARRFSDGEWVALGANDGTLPRASGPNNAVACFWRPRVVIGADDAPLVAYRAGIDVVVQRFDGTTWKGLAAISGDTFTQEYADFDLQLDPAGNPWFVFAPADYIAPLTAQRFNAHTSTWDTIGGPLPDDGVRLSMPKLQFDSTGNPVIGGVIQFNTDDNSTNNFGTVVYRYDGTTWASSGVHHVGRNADADFAAGMSIVNGQTYLSWINTATTDAIPTVLIQRNSGSTWIPVGSGDGEIPQYTERNNDPFSRPISTVVHSPVPMVTVGGDVYMAVLSTPVSTFYGLPYKVVLLKKVAE